ncbi:hypothetical protein MANES_01G032701v8 [Manihot esculenta]|uniref:Uncharacterized protein n=1 Tax=Manihot esculenta TaxID=3983 RepID=A0ACB7IF61_MANES|nr:hypothetical protein MANES_01G032701v8 [Manihot esculenta]
MRGLTLKELSSELNSVKTEVQELRERVAILELLNEEQNQPDLKGLEEEEENEAKSINNLHYVNLVDRVIIHKWHTKIIIVVHKEYVFQTIALIDLIDSGADLNSINEGLVPSRYFSKTMEGLNTTNGSKMAVRYKLNNTAICNKSICFEIPFLMVKGLSHPVILGNQFLHMIYPIKRVSEEGINTEIEGKVITFHFVSQPRIKAIDVLKNHIKSKNKFINSLKYEVSFKMIEEMINDPKVQQKIKIIQDKMLNSICAESPNAFWERKKHVVNLSYEPDFNEKLIRTKARPIAMGPRHLEICKKEVAELEKKWLIRKSKGPWSCPAFYVENTAELEWEVPRLVINYKHLNKVLRWIRYPLPNKRDLLNRLYEATVFSKFDMKSGYWQIQIS